MPVGPAGLSAYHVAWQGTDGSGPAARGPVPADVYEKAKRGLGRP
jgi:hypothetical protein